MKKEKTTNKTIPLTETEEIRELLNALEESNGLLVEYSKETIADAITKWDGHWDHRSKPLVKFMENRKDIPIIAAIEASHNRHVEQMNRLRTLSGA